MAGLRKLCSWTGIFIPVCSLVTFESDCRLNFYRRSFRKGIRRDRGSLERGMSSDSKWNIKHDRNEDVIFEREPKGWNEEEDEEGEPNVSLK